MSHPINDQIIENLSENYEIKQILLEDNVSISSRYVIKDENNELVRHDWKSSWSLKEDAEEALIQIVKERFEDLGR
tara:strand:- start:198 stop:425 length:228 start_codon:yes stop_codon:yes gene_type:complete